jgi:hypothetical protein
MIEGILNKKTSNFLIYSPEYSYLRNFSEEGQIVPLGTKGEGLFKLLTTFVDSKNDDKTKCYKMGGINKIFTYSRLV